MTIMERQPLPHIVLASGSPRRRELLMGLDLDFTVVLPAIDEKDYDLSHLSPAEKVMFLAREKAQSVAARYPDSLVIGSDTIVAMGEPPSVTVFEKPEDKDDAFRMLKALQGRTHDVYSGITVIWREKPETSFLGTRVSFRPMGDEDIRRYIDTGEPMDKAGAYAIQGYGSLLVRRVDGCYFNVVGMSMFLLNQLMMRHGFSLL